MEVASGYLVLYGRNDIGEPDGFYKLCIQLGLYSTSDERSPAHSMLTHCCLC